MINQVTVLCPHCKGKARRATIVGYSNIKSGSRTFCAHCGYVKTK